MKKKITILLAFVAVVLFVMCAYARVSTDRRAPHIEVPSTTITYLATDDEDVLLEGVTASDDRDGDITERIRIYDISAKADGNSALVTYAVYDSANNLAKATRTVNYVPANKIMDVEDATEVAEGTTEKPKEQTATEKPTEQVTTEQPTTEAPAPGYEDPELVSTGAPVMRLKTHEVRLKVGDRFNTMTYVDTAIDDKDNKNYLYEHMYLGDGSNYDTKTPGTYEISYYCVDSDGNRSNLAKLKLIVE